MTKPKYKCNIQKSNEFIYRAPRHLDNHKTQPIVWAATADAVLNEIKGSSK
jgi:hypothetical protein